MSKREKILVAGPCWSKTESVTHFPCHLCTTCFTKVQVHWSDPCQTARNLFPVVQIFDYQVQFSPPPSHPYDLQGFKFPISKVTLASATISTVKLLHLSTNLSTPVSATMVTCTVALRLAMKNMWTYWCLLSVFSITCSILVICHLGT